MTPRSKRVTVEHTRDRIRNNQRRHRARRKDYITTLEERLNEAERTISTLKSQVAELEEASKQDSGRTSSPLGAGSESMDIPEAPVIIDTDDLLLPITGFGTEEAGEINDPSGDDLPGMNIESTDLALSILESVMFPSLSQSGSPLAYQSYQISGYLPQNLYTPTINACCSPSIPTPSIPPIGTELSSELTRLCCEAYILIAQHNATVFRDETNLHQNSFPLPQLISCHFKMSCCLVKAEVSGPQVCTSISYVQCNS
ncbi:hypothetical protein FSHL1_010319 [Fusarium sambucinum]